jgi:hypothetical protein
LGDDPNAATIRVTARTKAGQADFNAREKKKDEDHPKANAFVRRHIR